MTQRELQALRNMQATLVTAESQMRKLGQIFKRTTTAMAGARRAHDRSRPRV